MLHYYPQAQAALEGRGKHFAIRAERTPSASLKDFDTEAGRVWHVTDFGGDGRAKSPLDICMAEEGIDFAAAVRLLAARYGLSQHTEQVAAPRFERVMAEEGADVGAFFFEVKERMSPEVLRLLGPRVTEEVARELNWYEAVWVGVVDVDRYVRRKYSTERYPILLRECFCPTSESCPQGRFYKVYEPRAEKKQYRFLTYPKGAKPKDYVFGLHELRLAYEAHRSQIEAEEEETTKGERQDPRLEEVFICSGERDALCVRALGYHPVWGNSETAGWSAQQLAELRKCAKRVYNIPDIDATGRRKGIELALQDIEVHTIWLPQWLGESRDWRGGQRKDFRDWVEIRPGRKDFEALLSLATPARFWEQFVKRDKAGKAIRYTYAIDAVCLHYFLGLTGFAALRDATSKSVWWVRVQGHRVQTITPKDIRLYLRAWAEERGLDRGIRNELLNSPRLADSALENLKDVELNFSRSDQSSQVFFVGNHILRVTAQGREELSSDSWGGYVWESDILPFRYCALEESFVARRGAAPAAATGYAVEVRHTRSKLFSYLINTSRLYWRKEIEEQHGQDWEAARAYHAAHRFSINGQGLTAGEQAEQMQNLASKLFAIGYMLHGYKSRSRAWAPFAMDNKVGEADECNGRSGKSILFFVLGQYLKRVVVSGRGGKKANENPHRYEQVTRFTDFVYIDDLDRSTPLETFYDMITEGMTINPKNNPLFTLSFEESPKFAFSTNYVPRKFNASTHGRLLPLVFSDYYHERTEDNDYRESRSVRDDFGMDLYGADYSPEDWNADFNFLLDCVAFYLRAVSQGEKITPPMHAITRRRLLAEIEGDFQTWADVFFSAESGNLNRRVLKKRVFDDFLTHTGGVYKHITQHGFTKKLRAYTALMDHLQEYDPKKRIMGKTYDEKSGQRRSEEFIMICTTDYDPTQSDPLPADGGDCCDALPF